MAMAISRRTIVGNIGQIYQKRTVGDRNQSVIEFSVACTPRIRDNNGEWKDGPTEWHLCKAWGQLADNIEKGWNSGDRVFVAGRIEMKPGYTDKEGVEHDPRPALVAEAAGHEDSRDYSTQHRTRRDGGRNGNNGNNSNNKPAGKPESKPKTDDLAALDDDADLDDLLGGLDDDDDTSGDLPF